MQYNIYLLSYNNYYNRQIRRLETIQDYINGGYVLNTVTNVNFEMADGINSKLVVNYQYVTEEPNYILVVDKTDVTKFTRWFVIESNLNRCGQYEFTVRRDVIAEYLNAVLDSPCMIKKGYVDNLSILSFNKEMQEYNKVKTAEKLLKDETNSGWVVGFIERDKNHSGAIKATYFDSRPVDFDYSALPQSIKNYMGIAGATPTSKLKILQDNDLHNVGIEANFTTCWGGATSDSIDVYRYEGYMFTNIGNYRGKYYFNIQGFTRTVDNNYCGLDETQIRGNYTINTHLAVNQGMSITASTNTIRNSTGQFAEYYSNKWHDNLSSYSKSYWWSVIPEITSNYGTYETLASYDNKICEIDGNYYRCRVVKNNSTQYQKIPFSSSPYSGQLTRHAYEALPTDDQMTSMQTSASYSETPKYFANHGPGTSDSSDYYLYYFLQDCYINLVQENIQVWTNLTNSTTRNHLIDAPYDMFVIPYSNDYQYTVNNQNYTANKAMAINLAIEMCRSLGTSAAYDIQIVPYCPMRNTGIINFDDFSLINYEPIRKGSTLTTSDPIVGYYFWSTTSSQEFTITETDPLLTLQNVSYSYKEITQLFEYILCSPAKDSTYEFNPAMNRGINSWQISFNYRPYSSYVKVQPTWDYLYGESSYNGLTDTRGLLFNGNYSITQLSNAWAEYLNQNKNYQQIFDTEVSTQINKFNKQQKAQWDTVGYRNFSINPFSFLKVIGENRQMQYDREVFDMDMKAQKDIFNYQLDNIKSQPDAISKLTSINVDFRIYPFIEIYMGHSDDIKNFRNAMKWNGMTIMVQGYIREYLKPNQEETYVEASILRFNDYVAQSCDFHLVTEINKELNKGLYFYADNTSNIDVQNENIGG